MKNIYICQSQKNIKSKFIENLKTLDWINIEYVNSNVDIYKSYINGTRNYIVSIDMIDNNVLSFLSDKKNENIKFFIDHSLSSKKRVNSIPDTEQVIHLVRGKDDTYKNHIDINQFINYQLYDLHNTVKNKQNIAAGFLTGLENEPIGLIQNIENKNLEFRIRLFDNPNIYSAYNVGILSEKEKVQILKTYKYYIDINNEYLQEAIICGAKILDPNSLKEISVQKTETEHTDLNCFIDKLI